MWSLLLTTAYAGSTSHGAAHGAAEAAKAPSVSVLGALILVAVCYVAAHFVVNRLQRFLLFVSGAEYILLGAAVGYFGSIKVFDNPSLAPVIAFAAGWVGLLYGMELHLRSLLDDDRSLALRMAFAEVVATALATATAAYLFFTSGLLIEACRSNEAMAAAAAMGCAAAAGSSAAIDLLEDTYSGLESRLLPLLRQTARMGDLLAIGLLGIVFSLFHHTDGGGSALGVDPKWAQWILATVLGGLGLGILFALFLGEHADENSRFLALVGIIVFAAGGAFFVEVSALTVNLILGATLVNTADGPQVRSTLMTSLKPVTLVLMVVAGALWAPTGSIGDVFGHWFSVYGLATIVVCLGFILLRGTAKAAALFLATVNQPVRRDVFRGLMGQGDVALAIAVSFRLVYEGPAADLAYTAILVSVMFHEVLAARLLKGLLIEAGELDDDAAWGAS